MQQKLKTATPIVLLSFILLLGISNCNRPPELPDEPTVSFENIEFEIINAGDPLFEENVLRLSMKVSDGNGDLGLDGDESAGIYAPFELVTDGGNFVEFGDRPDDPPFSCLEYVIEDQENTDLNKDGDLLDTLKINFNKNQFNVEVDFWVKKNGFFEEIDLRAQPPGSSNQNTLCGISFDGRFPCLSAQDNPCDFVTNSNSPIEGTVTYEMKSGLFLPLFRTDTLKLRFLIRDRALNESNVAETPEFTLQSIRKVNGEG